MLPSILLPSQHSVAIDSTNIMSRSILLFLPTFCRHRFNTRPKILSPSILRTSCHDRFYFSSQHSGAIDSTHRPNILSPSILLPVQTFCRHRFYSRPNIMSPSILLSVPTFCYHRFYSRSQHSVTIDSTPVPTFCHHRFKPYS